MASYSLLRILGILLLMAPVATLAQALDFSTQPIVYYESYADESESATATTPEIDTQGIGSGQVYGVSSCSFVTCNYIPGTGSSVQQGDMLISVVDSPYSWYEEAVIYGSLSNSTNISSSFGIRSLFEGAAHEPGRQGMVTVRVGFGAAESLRFSVFINDSTSYLWLAYEKDNDQRWSLRELPPADSAAIRNGGPFVLDLSYDRVNFIARGSITVEGFGEYSLDPKDLAGFAGIDPIFFFYNGGGVDNLNVDFSVNMKEITVYGGAANSVTGPVDLLDPHVSAGSALLGSSGIARIEQPRVDAIE
ncbi:MAG: hypothetical protein PVF69_14540, partial [Gemmatimonadota bacterium]